MRLAGIGAPHAPAAWEALGCTVVGGAVPFGNGAILLGRDGLVVDDVPNGLVLPTDVEGVGLAVDLQPPAVEHPAGAVELDHLVLLTDSLERTSEAVHSALGLECRRIRETGTVRQAFHRFDDVDGPSGERVRGCIIEIVESDRVATTTMMGMVVIVDDLFGLAERLGPDVMSSPKPAVQPGRHISTVRRDVGLGTAVALMTPGG
jgi:hypothetical protein